MQMVMLRVLQLQLNHLAQLVDRHLPRSQSFASLMEMAH
jgi:hypothetical protein